nr:PEP-CTERM sorting domain-containing protein [uncultured Desulfobulbus sp.]
MKKTLVASVSFAGLLTLALCQSANATLSTGTPSPSLSPVFGTLIDFDDQATGTAVGAGDYVSMGLASITETEGLGFFGRYSGTQSSPNYVGTGVNGERGTDASMGWDGTILMQFAKLASMVGIGIADSAGGPEWITVYDSGMNVLESYMATTGANVYNVITRGSYDIKYLEVKGDFFAIDDLQFNSSVIPEPTTMLLFGTGLAGLAALGRRRKE